jgi:hypothetical protein
MKKETNMTLAETRSFLLSNGVTDLVTLEGLTPDVLLDLVDKAYGMGFDDGHNEGVMWAQS